MEDRWKREGRGGEKRKRFLLSSPPSPLRFPFVLSSKLSRQTRAETLAIQASLALTYDVQLTAGRISWHILPQNAWISELDHSRG